MARLDSALIDSFVKATKPTPAPKTETFIYGTVQSVDDAGEIANVLFDGADTPTPCEYSVLVKEGNRVTVMVKNRKPVVMSNNSSPSTSIDYLKGEDALFDGTVEVIWYQDGDVENEQRAYIGDEDSNAPLLVKYTSKPVGTLVRGAEIILYDEDQDKYAYGKADGGWYGSSDKRIKTDICDCDPELARKLRPVAFRFAKATDERHYGFIAQEVQEIVPDAVSVGPKGYLGLNYTELIAPILALVQEQEKRIEELERKVSDLEAERDQLPADEE